MSQKELNELVRRCQQETDTYRRTGSSDSSPCLELFRLALGENREDAWEMIIEQYTPDLRNRFHRHHPWNSLLREDQDDIILEAFERLLGQNRKKPLQISSLGGILKYLYSCLSTVILLHKRAREKDRFIVGEPNDFADAPGPDLVDRLFGNIAALEILHGLNSCCDNTCEEQVIYQWLTQDDTAPEIVQDLPACHLTNAKVYQIVEKVLARYRKRYPLSGNTKFKQAR
jgi:hypothetical protein